MPIRPTCSTSRKLTRKGRLFTMVLLVIKNISKLALFAAAVNSCTKERLSSKTSPTTKPPVADISGGGTDTTGTDTTDPFGPTDPTTDTTTTTTDTTGTDTGTVDPVVPGDTTDTGTVVPGDTTNPSADNKPTEPVADPNKPTVSTDPSPLSGTGKTVVSFTVEKLGQFPKMTIKRAEAEDKIVAGSIVKVSFTPNSDPAAVKRLKINDQVLKVEKKDKSIKECKLNYEFGSVDGKNEAECVVGP